MTTTIFGITNTTKDLYELPRDWDELKVVLTDAHGLCSPILSFKASIPYGSTHNVAISTSTLDRYEKISYCGLYNEVRVYTSDELDIHHLIRSANNLLGG